MIIRNPKAQAEGLSSLDITARLLKEVTFGGRRRTETVVVRKFRGLCRIQRGQ